MRKYEGIKKVELNCSFEGSLNVELATKWLKIPNDEVKNLLTRYNTKSASEYLEKLDKANELLQLKTHIKDAAYILAEEMKNENVIYAEINLDPMAHLKKGLSIEEVIDFTLLGIKLGELKANLILTMRREASIKDNKKVIDVAKRYLNKGVVAVELVGDETLFPTSSFKDLFAYADTKKVPFVVRAGETGTYKDIQDAISLGAKRIVSGVLAIKDFKTMENLKKKHIPIDMCISSAVDMKIYNVITEHPINRLIDSGVMVTVNSDNRTISKTDLSHEYYLLNKYFKFEEKDFTKANRIALEHSFLSDKDKEELLKEIA